MSEELEEYAEQLSSLVSSNGLAPKYQEQIFTQSEVIKVKKREVLFEQGARDDLTFYILDGDLDMFAEDQLIKQVSGGTKAAFHPLAQLQPRQMSAHAKTAVKVLRVDRNLLDKLLSVDSSGGDVDATGMEGDEIDDDSGDWLSRILQSELFARLPPSNIKLLATVESVEFKSGETVVSQGEPGDYYSIVQSGRCAVTRKGSKGTDEITLAELAAGDSFGEEALMTNSKRNTSVSMLTDDELVHLTKGDFVELIKKPIISTVTVAEAEEMTAGGAVWLDVRFPDEHAGAAFEDSLNIPINTLRTQAGDKLDLDTAYIVHCDTGGRSSAATFLLAERGFDAYYVEGGHIPSPPSSILRSLESCRDLKAGPAAQGRIGGVEETRRDGNRPPPLGTGNAPAKTPGRRRGEDQGRRSQAARGLPAKRRRAGEGTENQARGRGSAHRGARRDGERLDAFQANARRGEKEGTTTRHRGRATGGGGNQAGTSVAGSGTTGDQRGTSAPGSRVPQISRTSRTGPARKGFCASGQAGRRAGSGTNYRRIQIGAREAQSPGKRARSLGTLQACGRFGALESRTR